MKQSMAIYLVFILRAFERIQSHIMQYLSSSKQNNKTGLDAKDYVFISLMLLGAILAISTSELVK